MKAVRETIRKYYKQGYIIPWTQPVCTSNNSHGTFTGGGYFSESSGDRAYYHVSDNSWPTSPIGGGWDGTCWGTTHSAYGWFNWKLPKTIRITGIKVMARNYSQSSSDYVVSNARFYTDSSKTTPLGDTFNLNGCGQQLVISNINEDGIITDNLYFVKNGGGEYSGFAEIWITAYEWGVTEATETDYDFYKDIYKYRLPKITERKYYKYVIVESSFVQPILSSNGTMGGDKFACSSNNFPWSDTSQCYLMFNGVDGGFNGNGTSHNGGGWIKWYNPKPLKITNVWCAAGYSGDWFNVTFRGSNDGTNWTDVAYFAHGVRQNCPVNSPDFYKYWMMYNNSGFSHDGHGYGGGISEIHITGIERVESIEESTESDYDFYVDNDTYKAIKSYTKGQYYGN